MVNGITSGIQISPVQYTCFDGAKKKPLYTRGLIQFNFINYF